MRHCYPNKIVVKIRSTEGNKDENSRLVTAAVESVPGKVGGVWVFKDTRMPVATVIENLEDLSIEEVMEQFDVTREQLAAVLDFVAHAD
jgi:uncharacterized protein (DUF433 family)